MYVGLTCLHIGLQGTKNFDINFNFDQTAAVLGLCRTGSGKGGWCKGLKSRTYVLAPSQNRKCQRLRRGVDSYFVWEEIELS